MEPDVTCVLVVDDDVDVLDSLVMVLTEEGFFVVAALTADEAALLARLYRPRVALVDYHIPDVDVRALVARLRGESPMTWVVLCTADEAAYELMVAAGADAALKKPFAVDDLIALLRAREAAAQAPAVT